MWPWAGTVYSIVTVPLFPCASKMEDSNRTFLTDLLWRQCESVFVKHLTQYLHIMDMCLLYTYVHCCCVLMCILMYTAAVYLRTLMRCTYMYTYVHCCYILIYVSILIHIYVSFCHQCLALNRYLNKRALFSFSFCSPLWHYLLSVFIVYIGVTIDSSLVSFFIQFLLILIHTHDFKVFLCSDGSQFVWPAYTSLLSNIIWVISSARLIIWFYRVDCWTTQVWIAWVHL